MKVDENKLLEAVNGRCQNVFFRAVTGYKVIIEYLRK